MTNLPISDVILQAAGGAGFYRFGAGATLALTADSITVTEGGSAYVFPRAAPGPVAPAFLWLALNPADVAPAAVSYDVGVATIALPNGSEGGILACLTPGAASVVVQGGTARETAAVQF